MLSGLESDLVLDTGACKKCANTCNPSLRFRISVSQILLTEVWRSFKFM